jgi:hypothetical protein
MASGRADELSSHTRILEIQLDGDHVSADRWPLDGAWRALRGIQEAVAAADGSDRQAQLLVALVIGDELGWRSEAFAEATAEALRGVVQSTTREIDPRSVRCNLVVASVGGAEDQRRIIDYLVSDDGAFCAGATFDVR